MLPKFTIFVVISGIFAVSIYTSSASGLPTITYGNLRCHMDPTGNSGYCCYFGEPPVCYNCVLQENGKWDCVKSSTMTPSPALKDAIVKAQAGNDGGGLTTGDNNTTVKKGEQLKAGSSLKSGY